MYSGPDGVREYFRDVAAVWDELQLAPREFHTAADYVVAIGTVAGKRGAETLDAPAGWAWKLQDGRIVLGRAYERPDEALTDAGIEVKQDPAEY
jgi:ketosteroid isomerase-like protein